MPTPAELYVRGIRKKTKIYFAAWLPNAVLKLGDVGPLEGGFLKKDFFKRWTSLGNLGISFRVRQDKSPTPLEFISHEGISITTKIAGEANNAIPALPTAKAGISLSFSSEGGYVFQAAESYEPTIDDMESVKKQVANAYKEGQWEKNWAIITKIVNVPYATYIISESSNSELVLEADADFKQGIADLGNASINLTWRKETGSFVKMAGAKNISPFFQLARLKGGWPFGDPILTGKMSRTFSTPNPLESITPQIVRENKEVEDSLFLDLITDDDIGTQ
jgi:hypothetical protein